MNSRRNFTFKGTDSDRDLGELSGRLGQMPDNTSVSVTVTEVVDPDYSCYTWPSAVVLAQFIWHHRAELRGKILLEISAVIVSEYALNPVAVERCRSQAVQNQVAVRTAGVIWGQVTADLSALPALDVVVLSDVFYDPVNFSDVLFTIDFLLTRHPLAKCYFAYQIRDDNWNVHFLLRRFGLQCRKIELADFGGAGGELAGSNLPGSTEIEMFECRRRSLS
uniref:Putative methyltransferase-like protein 23 n=1 Tax=Hypsibius dujardini TaxID=232323 RepID=A0A0U3C3R7_HYPDU|nr:putative methyltransferase-like protein 23 [Hypsibius dujardini]